MKKKIALLIILILAVSLTLVACNQTAATSIRTRWDKDGETHVFNITLADFNGDSNSFLAYSADGVAVANGKYHKDIAFAGEFTNWDEIRPLAVLGSYTIDIKPSADGTAYCDVKTVQEMCVAYKDTDIAENSEIRSAAATQEQLDKYPVDTFGSKVVVLWSQTETSVRFENTDKQKPLSSTVKVNGFYAGKTAQQLTNYELSTVYDYSEKRPVAKITLNGETTEYKFSRNSAGTFIDSNQILLYLRSLDKSSSSFQDSPSKSVFNPYNQTLQTASFGLSYEYNVLLTGENVLATTLNVVSVKVGNNAFMMQENLPDTIKLGDKKLDVYTTPNSKDSRFTTVRFRVGYFAYEINYSNTENTTDWSEIWTALSPAVSEE
ncbi:MAG: hypothetical protein J1F68_02200 [Clostridiales bacterium]|nr:hypothetical protein [Clostridiales bacterium]